MAKQHRKKKEALKEFNVLMAESRGIWITIYAKDAAQAEELANDGQWYDEDIYDTNVNERFTVEVREA